MKSKKVFQPQQFDPPTTLLSLRNADDLHWEMQELQLAITRRAYELFQARGCEHGHDWEDWFRAESELLRPVSVCLSESEDRVSVRANVFGFDEKELKVAIEPRRITILGTKQASVAESEGGRVKYIDWYPDQILKFIDLAEDVIPEGAIVELQAGMLKFELPKVGPAKVEAAAAAA